jgi:hypothetical protein
MLALCTGTTPNGRNASIMLEEIGASYDVKSVNPAKKEQFAPDFLKLSPNNKIPALVSASLAYWKSVSAKSNFLLANIRSRISAHSLGRMLFYPNSSRRGEP